MPVLTHVATSDVCATSLRRGVLVSLFATGLIWAHPVLAQATPVEGGVEPDVVQVEDDSGQPVDNGQLEEITVTASRYQETLQTTPVVVSALGENALTKRGIVDVSDLSTQVPSLQMGTNGQNASVDISIRGITTNNVNTYAGNPSVATYINGVYVARSQGLNASLFDIERVEILRGPQGTLYGRNATAGAINIITAKPTQSLEYRLEGTIGNHGARSARAMLNLPVNDVLAVRGAFFFDRNDGYQDTLGTTERNYFRANNVGGRVSALLKPSNGLSIYVDADAFRERGSPALPIPTSVPRALNPGVPINPVSPVTDPYNRPVTPGREGILEIDVFNVRTNIELGLTDTLTLAYLGGYGTVDALTTLDGDGLPVDAYVARFDDSNWNTSHELLLSYGSDKLKAVLGANFTAEGTSGDLAVDFPGGGGVPRRSLHFPHPDYYQDAVGVFGQATYSVTDAFRLTGGLRYSSTHASNENFLTQFCSVNAPLHQPRGSSFCATSIPNLQRPRSFNSVSWKAGFDFDAAQDSLIFGSISTGFKQGALNSESTLLATPEVRPETVTNYELGTKNRLFDGKVTLNATAYYMDYADLQVSQVVFVTVSPPVTTNITSNAAKARVYGFELEAAWRVTPDTQIGGFANSLHARYTSFPAAIDPILDPASRIPLDLSGNHLIRSPEVMIGVNVDHTIDLGGRGSLTPYASFYYQSSSFLREFNQPFDREPGYTRTDLRLTYRSPDSRVTVEAFVQNLENNAVRVAEYPVSILLASFYAPPRRLGVRVAYEF